MSRWFVGVPLEAASRSRRSIESMYNISMHVSLII